MIIAACLDVFAMEPLIRPMDISTFSNDMPWLAAGSQIRPIAEHDCCTKYGSLTFLCHSVEILRHVSILESESGPSIRLAPVGGLVDVARADTSG
jgi:hypothetical protein